MTFFCKINAVEHIRSAFQITFAAWQKLRFLTKLDSNIICYKHLKYNPYLAKVVFNELKNPPLLIKNVHYYELPFVNY